MIVPSREWESPGGEKAHETAEKAGDFRLERRDEEIARRFTPTGRTSMFAWDYGLL